MSHDGSQNAIFWGEARHWSLFAAMLTSLPVLHPPASSGGLGVVNLCLVLYNARATWTPADADEECESEGEGDVPAAFAFFFTGCLNLLCMLVRAGAADALTAFMAAVFALAGALNIAVALRILLARRAARRGVLPLHAGEAARDAKAGVRDEKIPW